MALITDRALTSELRRLWCELDPATTKRPEVHELVPERVRFVAQIEDRTVEFSVPVDELHSGTMEEVSRRYLAPLLRRVLRV